MYCRYAKFYTDDPKDLWCYRFGIPYNVYQKECINCKSSPEYIEKVFEKEVYFDDANGKRVIIHGGIVINEEN